MSRMEDVKWQIQWAKENGIKPSDNVTSEDIEWLIETVEKYEKVLKEIDAVDIPDATFINEMRG